MRFIDFAIAGAKTTVLVHLEEQTDGSILVKLKQEGVQSDLRGLFFDINDPALIGKLSVSGAAVTGFEARNEGVIDLGQGANLQGNPLGMFDVGVRFGTPGAKEMVTATSFVLKSSVGGLTLDDLALADVGIRTTSEGTKLVGVMPAAPDAIDDKLTAVEDTPVVLHVLANDTDADGTTGFRITRVGDPAHGTATISADGKSIIYVADPNYSGPDSFTYDMIDGKGGGDSATATMTVEAVADTPTLTVTTAPGANVNQIVITVTAAVTDTDGSEYLDRFTFSGLPAGASIAGESDLVYNPDSTTPTMSKSFTVDLAANSDFDFNLGVTAWSKELSNGSEASTTSNTKIVIDAASNEFDLTFLATDQSIWGTGDALGIRDERFLGFDWDPKEKSSGGFVYGAIDVALKAGFQTTLDLSAGSIDASVPYDVTVNTTYNHVTDVLLISSSAALTRGGVSFTTTGPGGNFALDFIFNYYFKASAGLDFEVEKYGLFSVEDRANYTFNILDLDAADLQFSYDFPYGISASLAWPTINTTSGLGSFSSSGASNNFFTLGLDVDDLLTKILNLPASPFGVSIDVLVAKGSADLIDVDLSAGMNLLQEFLLSVTSLTGTLVFENGAKQAWKWGDTTITGASTYDSDNDGVIEFVLDLDPQASLSNKLGLGFNFGYDIDLLKASGSYDVLIDSGEWSIGPVLSFGDTIPLGSVDIYSSTFALDLVGQSINFNANSTLLG
ncbi:cadherin-like domain-containing protein [Sphingomonas kaistensis]|uniref:Cadherin-like domain-containing protein n=1 Tax=Sphingomonas kaistensis TaxID=298708 RepID=A0ABZ2FXP9_9SPHN